MTLLKQKKNLLQATLITLSLICVGSINAQQRDIPVISEQSLNNNDLILKGLSYYEKKDYSTAKEYFLKAANNGSDHGQNIVANMYMEGLGGEKDYQKGLFYFEKAAEKNLPSAISSVAEIYFKGIGVNKDIVKAFSYYDRAAQLGDDKSANLLAYQYTKGELVTKDLRKAEHYYLIAAEKENPMALYNLGYMNQYQLPEINYTKAREYYLRAANKNLTTAMLALVVIYHQGIGIEPNIEEANKWLKKAAELGDEMAIKMLNKQK